MLPIDDHRTPGWAVMALVHAPKTDLQIAWGPMPSPKDAHTPVDADALREALDAADLMAAPPFARERAFVRERVLEISTKDGDKPLHINGPSELIDEIVSAIETLQATFPICAEVRVPFGDGPAADDVKAADKVVRRTRKALEQALAPFATRGFVVHIPHGAPGGYHADSTDEDIEEMQTVEDLDYDISSQGWLADAAALHLRSRACREIARTALERVGDPEKTARVFAWVLQVAECVRDARLDREAIGCEALLEAALQHEQAFASWVLIQSKNADTEGLRTTCAAWASLSGYDVLARILDAGTDVTASKEEPEYFNGYRTVFDVAVPGDAPEGARCTASLFENSVTDQMCAEGARPRGIQANPCRPADEPRFDALENAVAGRMAQFQTLVYVVDRDREMQQRQDISPAP